MTRRASGATDPSDQDGVTQADKLHESSAVRAVFSPSFERMPADAGRRPDRAEVPFGTQDAALGFSEVTQLASNALSREAQLLQDVCVTRVVAQALQIRVNLQTAQAGITLFVGAVQPLKGLIRLAAICIYLAI